MSNNNKHYCKYCKIFVQDNISVKNHEDGWRHKNNVTRFVSTQNRDKRYQERDAKEAEREINKIKNTGTKSFREKDLSRVLDEKRQQQTQQHQQQAQQTTTNTDTSFKDIVNQQRQQINNNDYYNYYQDKQKLIYNYYKQEENSIQPEPPLNTSLYGYTDSPGLKYSSSSNDTDTNSGSMNSSTSSFTQRKRKQDDSNSPVPTKISRDQNDEPNNEDAENDEEEREEGSDNDEKEGSGSDDEEGGDSSSEIDQSESIVGQWESVSSHESAFGSTRPDTDDECDQDDEVKQCKKDDINDGKDYSDISDVDSEEEEINITKRALSNHKNKTIATIVSPTIPLASKSFENKLSFNKSGVFTSFALNGNKDTSTTTTPIQPTPPISLKFNKPLKQRNIRKTNIEDKQT